jgi:hypothetical protein
MSHTELPVAIEGARSRRIGVKAAAGVSCLVVLSLSCFVLRAQAIPQDSFRLRHGHPYLLFTKPDIARFKERVATEPATEKLWQSALATADQAAGSSGASARAPMEELCLAYQMTGDAKYARRIQQILEQMAQRPDFSDPAMLERDPPWHSALGTGSMVYTFAIGFDSIHDFLSSEQRKALATALSEKGVRLILEDWVSGASRIHSLDTMGHNWWSALVFNAGIGSIAIFDEEPQARQWLSKIDEASVEWMTYAGSNLETKPASFDREGGFYESVNYADFATNQYLRYRLGWINAFQSPKPATVPVVEKIGDFFCAVSYDLHGSMVSTFFGDGNLHAPGREAVLLAWADGFRKPSYLWFLNKFRTPPPNGGPVRVSPVELVYGPSQAEFDHAPATPELPPSKLFPDMGWATLRSSWDDNATLLGVKSGFTWNHSHADAGSFVLFHGGDYLLVDSGGTPSYAAPEYDDYFRQSKAHNVVLFNGQAQNPEDTYFGSQFPGSVSHLMDAGDLKYVFADATGPTAWRFVRNFRHFLWIGDVLLIIDDVKSFEPGQFEWTLHVGGKVKRSDLDLAVAGDTGSVLVRPLFPETLPGNAGLSTDYPEKMRLVEKTGLKDHNITTPDTYYSFVPNEKTRRTKFIVAIILINDKNKNNLPKLERLQTLNMDGVRIRQNDTVTDVYLNLLADGSIRHRNANATINGWGTDAYLMAISFPKGADMTNIDAASRLFIADGSYLRRDDRVIVDSLSKLFMTESMDGKKISLLLEGQPDINVAIHSKQKPGPIELNGVSVELPYDSSSQTFAARVARDLAR